MNRHIQIAAGFQVAALLVELVSLRWAHPTAFVMFAGFGGLLFLIGMVIYLRAAFLSTKP
jgi:hypothetical protein